MDSDSVSAVAINVGSQTGEPLGRGPIFSDGSFQYVPITEKYDEAVDWPTYADLGYTNLTSGSSGELVTHFDPEFPELPGGEHYTFADPGRTKTRHLAKLSEGDYVFLYGTLDFVGSRRQQYWITDGWGGYVFGHFQLQRDPISIQEYRELSEAEQAPFSNNAHLRRPEQDSNLVMLLGDPENSKLYETAVPLTLPEGSLGADEKRSAFFDSDEVDINMVWYRGPIQLTAAKRDELLTAHQTGNARHLYGPSLSAAPGFEDFEAELRPPSSFSAFREFIQTQDLHREQELLAAFSYISGGWTIEVPKALVTEDGLDIQALSELSTTDGVHEALTDVFTRVHASSDWPHGHRRNVPRNAGKRRDDNEQLGPYEAEILIESVETFKTDVASSFMNFLDGLDRDEPFVDGLEKLKRVYSFQRLAAFDLLELIVQVLNYEWLAPDQLRYEYVNSNGPISGLEHVFGDDVRTLGVREQTHYLTRLVAYAVEEREMSLADAIFAVESALCNCQKANGGAA
ncbi:MULTISPECIES: hypothetical protein [unclassified Halorubrum]|uniref:Nmad3 family putative nucleotide modification protein n=1 Tax=unclassified Halorubrum TaxID=2642239 RepID=UPI0011C41F69|nr:MULTISPECIES: hypothetical protein [unclassified Halorubrum]